MTVFEYVDLKDYIGTLFDRPVDVVTREGLKPYVRPRRDRRRDLCVLRRAKRSSPRYRASYRSGDPLHRRFGPRHVQGRPSGGFMRSRGALRSYQKPPRRLPNDLKARHPDTPAIAWRQMAAAGNVYRHDYEDVAAQFVWDTVAAGFCRPCARSSKRN